MSAQTLSSNMIIRKKVQKDPVLEVLQREAEEASNIPEGLPQLKEKTKRVQAGWLFNVRGALALKHLLLAMDSTADSPRFPGWRDLACQLQLDSLLIQCIKNKMFAGNTDTYYTLLAVAQYHERTLCHVLEALETIKRYDAIQRSKDAIDRLATYVLENTTTINSTDIILPPAIEIPPSELLIPDEELLNRMKCSVNPDSSALNLSMLQKMLDLLTQNPLPRQQKISKPPALPTYETIRLVTSAPIEERPSPPPVKKSAAKIRHDCIIMLTFASDGERYIPDIVESLRREREDGKRIGVLILEEHSDKVELNPQQFISNVFNQVNYVMPVITAGYLRSVASTSQAIYHDPNDFLDTKWTRYIYNLMNSDYLRRGCLNKKVRCVVPDDLVQLTQTHRRMREPIFETWDRASNIHKMGDRLLANVKRRNFH